MGPKKRCNTLEPIRTKLPTDKDFIKPTIQSPFYKINIGFLQDLTTNFVKYFSILSTMILKIITPSPIKYKSPMFIGQKSSPITMLNLIHRWIVTNMLLYHIIAVIISLIKFKTRT
jgi:hypothetical protein